MISLAYLQHVKKVIPVGANILELYAQEIPKFKNNKFHGSPGRSLKNLVSEMLSIRQPLGSFGGYTISTLLSMLALDDFRTRSDLFADDIAEAMVRGLEFVFYFILF